MRDHGGQCRRIARWRALALRVAVAVLIAWAPASRASMTSAQDAPAGDASHAGSQAGPSGGGGGSGRSDTGKRERRNDAEPVPRPGPITPAAPPETIVFVAQVRFAAQGTVVVDGGTVTSNSAWTAFLAPGMWVRAEGAWTGTDFRASTLAVTSPVAFCFYLGPADPLDGGEGWTEAWFAADPSRLPPATGIAPLARRASTVRAQALWLGRWAGDAWAGAPASVAPPAPPQEGWWLLRGTLDSGTAPIRWSAPTPFPPSR